MRFESHENAGPAAKEMKPIRQTIFGDKKGNCFAACVASVLELPLGTVPNFCVAEGDWLIKANAWLVPYGVALMDLDLPKDGSMRNFHALSDGIYVFLSGKSPRGEFSHSVVGRYRLYDDGRHQLEYAHDPHPSDAYLDGPPKIITVILALHPHHIVASRVNQLRAP